MSGEIGHGTWGERTRVFRNDTCLVTYLDLLPGKRCSWHSHKTAFNLFFVVEGKLGVKTGREHTTILKPGQTPFVTQPGLEHEFITYNEPTKVIEVAYVQYDENDIDRVTLGGDIEDEPRKVE